MLYRLSACVISQAIALGALAEPPRLFELTSPWGSQTYGTLLCKNGSVAIARSANPSPGVPFRWTQWTGTEQIVFPAEWTWIQPQCVSPDGETLVGFARYAPEPSRVFRWTKNGTTAALATVPGLSHYYAFGMSRDAKYVVGHASDGRGRTRALLWMPGGAVLDLGTLGEHHYPSRVSDDGKVVTGYYRRADGTERAFRWTAVSGMREIGALGKNSSAGLMNADGSVVYGSYQDFDDTRRVFVWTPELGAVPFRSRGVEPEALYKSSEDGSVMIGMASEPSLWTAKLGSVNLYRYLARRGVDVSNWFFISITDISEDGRTVAGLAATRTLRAFVVTGIDVNSPCQADLDADGVVDERDFALFLTTYDAYSCKAAADPNLCPGDFNADDVVDDFDFEFFAGAIGESGC